MAEQQQREAEREQVEEEEEERGGASLEWHALDCVPLAENVLGPRLFRY